LSLSFCLLRRFFFGEWGFGFASVNKKSMTSQSKDSHSKLSTFFSKT
jgi:hypothetical protein